MSAELASALPDLLTVEEAARVLRIGRTKAYALTQEWRTSGGTSGLPVVDLGSVLRVPRHALEAMVGGTLTAAPRPAKSDVNAASAPATPPTRRVSRRRPSRDRDQLRLLDLTDPAS